ncbi:MAG TPA: hypothetical protein VLI04_12110, partial [Nocardioidaceae bacterium]|nr:hypothetical protein [Nocardioidaceae bacterium]
MSLSRRVVLSGALGAAAATAAGASSASASNEDPFIYRPGTPTRTERRRAVVVGSGFGGGVAALRLGQAGVDTLVLERGQWWHSAPNRDTFSRLLTPDHRAGWFRTSPPILESPPVPLTPYAGVMERSALGDLDLICGAGVGGTSLVYHGATWQPSEANFYRVMPGGIDFDEMNQVYYPRASGVLGAKPIPDDVLDHKRYATSKRFLELGREIGMTERRMGVTTDWDVVRRELRGELKPWVSEGEFAYGMNNGAKLSVDRTYIRLAQATGHVDVAALHVVTSVSKDAQGRWVTKANRITPYGVVVEKVVIISDALVLAAGSLNTSRLLLHAKHRGDLPDLPDTVGHDWGNNGDRVFSLVGVNEDQGTRMGGPVAGGVVDWDSGHPVTLESEPLPLPIESRTIAIFGMGIPDGHGRYYYSSATGKVRLDWSDANDLASRTAIRAKVAQLQKKVGGAIVDLNAADRFVAHILGGAALGSVTDLHGRVHGHRGLYV